MIVSTFSLFVLVYCFMFMLFMIVSMFHCSYLFTASCLCLCMHDSFNVLIVRMPTCLLIHVCLGVF